MKPGDRLKLGTWELEYVRHVPRDRKSGLIGWAEMKINDLTEPKPDEKDKAKQKHSSPEKNKTNGNSNL